MQQTYFMIKPEIVAAGEQRIGEILAIVNRAGFRLTALEMRQLDRPAVEEFYAEHEGKGFFAELVEYISSGPVVAVRLEREDAVAKLRELIGATNPAEAATRLPEATTLPLWASSRRRRSWRYPAAVSATPATSA